MKLARKAKAVRDSSLCHEPKDGWVALDRILWHCDSKGIIPQDLWIDRQIARLKCLTSNLTRCPYPPLLSIGMSPEPRWDIGTEGSFISIRAAGVKTLISHRSLFVMPDADIVEEPTWAIHITGLRDLHLVFDDQEWEQVWENCRVSADWHRWLLMDLVDNWRGHFAEAVWAEAMHLMARKALLSPFERIAWDQWQFFAVDQYEDSIAQRKGRSIELRGSLYGEEPPASATGPSGERLYSIYVAPGNPVLVGGQSPGENCLRWLLELMRVNPEQAPKPLPKLAEEAVTKFPGLTKRGFERSYLLACEKAGNSNWSRAGRPKKCPQKIPATK